MYTLRHGTKVSYHYNPMMNNCDLKRKGLLHKKIFKVCVCVYMYVCVCVCVCVCWRGEKKVGEAGSERGPPYLQPQWVKPK